MPVTAPRNCPYCGTPCEAGARECPSCRFPDLDAPAPAPTRATATKPAPPGNEKATCAHCGAEFDARRLSCPGCGSDADTGWKSSEEIDELAVELPEDEPEAYSDSLLGDHPGDRSSWGGKQVRSHVVTALGLAVIIVMLLVLLWQFAKLVPQWGDGW